MLVSSTYQIADEPRPGTLSQWAVDPFWPLLAMMLGGAWLAWPWFVLNGFAVGSPTRRRELVVAITGFVGSAVLVLALFALDRHKILTAKTVNYALLVLLVWKLGISYWLHILQRRTFSIYQYYGGTVKNGFIGLFIGFILGPKLLKAAHDTALFLYLVMR